MEIQSKLLKLGNYGYYYLCLLKATNTSDSKILELYDYFVKKGYMTEDCYIQDPIKMLKYLTGNNYKVEKLEKLPIKYDFYIELWYNSKTGLGHFTLHDWDSLGNSNTRLNGKIDSYRVFTKLL